ncbi:MAG: hypothetical protein M0Z55_00540 [Peptococcaceae bacterium]|nr:hypothetical protein [Peptococcaceae bacterium]
MVVTRKRGIWLKLIYLGLTLAFTLLALLLPLGRVQGALFAPGPGVHAGQVGCDACHQPFQTAYTCTNAGCHPLRVKTYKNLPNYYFHKLLAKQSCTSCHQEHNSTTDAYVGVAFLHGAFPVAASQDCEQCHAVKQDVLHDNLQNLHKCVDCHSTLNWTRALFDHKFVVPDRLAKCVLCHTAPPNAYHALVSNNCAGCHRSISWWPAGSNHAELNSKGKVMCGTCHPAPHDQEHQMVGLNCGKCHNTQKW